MTPRRQRERQGEHPSAHASEQDRHEVVQERGHAERVEAEPQPVARAPDLRHLVQHHQAHQQREEDERPRARAAAEVEDHVGAEEAAVEEVERVDVVGPPARDPAGRRPEPRRFAMLQHDQAGEARQVGDLEGQIGPGVDALHGEEVEEEAGREHQDVRVRPQWPETARDGCGQAVEERRHRRRS